jgi:hypothetical protein
LQPFGTMIPTSTNSPAPALEHRVTQLEAELAQIKQLLQRVPSSSHPWWEEVFGTFANCSAFDEMERLGREWRDRSDDLQEFDR